MRHKQSLFFVNAQNKGIVGIFALVLILVIAVAGGAYYLGRTTTKPQVTETDQATSTAPLPSKASATEGDPTVNWKIFKSKFVNYTFKYPADWGLIEIPKEALPGRPDFVAHSPDAQFSELGGWLTKGMKLDVDVTSGEDLKFPFGFLPADSYVPSQLKGNAIIVRLDPENIRGETYEALAKVVGNGNTITFNCSNLTEEQKSNPTSCLIFLNQLLSTFQFTSQ